jgi:DNA-binding CsgD family transcriptional regulator/tetratricopeptide (TPR) repeat protein
MIATMAPRVTSPILVGRVAELDRLREGLGAAARGEPELILLGGEAGIGKTRLVRELVGDARVAGVTVLEGACVSLGTDDALPFAPLAQAIRGLVRAAGIEALVPHLDAATGELSRLVPQLVGPGQAEPPTGRPDWAQTRIFEGVLALLERLGRQAPVLLVLEDLHWADRSTRDLVAYLARSVSSERLTMLVTYRSDELHRRHPLRPWLAEIDRLPVVTRLELARLTPDEVGEQLRAILERAVSADLATTIARRSAGNPLFAEELLAARRGSPAPDQSGLGGGAAGAPPESGVPETLRELLLARVRGLSDPAQEVLGCAAVAGAAFPHDLLRDCVLSTIDGFQEESDVSACLREAIAAQLIVIDPADPSGYAFRHALVQEAVADELLPADRRRYHARYASLLAALPVESGAAGASQLAAMAVHATAAHDLSLALRAWIQAADASLDVYAVAEAAHAFERAMELWDAVPADDRPHGVDFTDVCYRASLAFIGSGELVRARDVIALAVERVDPKADPVRAAVLRERYARTLWLTGDLQTAVTTLDDAAALIEDLPPTPNTARVVASLAGILVLGDQTTRAIEVGERAAALAIAVGDRAIEAYVLAGLGVARVNHGDEARGLDELRTGLRLAHELRLNGIDFHRAYSNLSSGLQIAGRLEESVAVALEGVGWAKARGMWRLQGVFLEANAAAALVELGRWDEARLLLDLSNRPPTQGVALLNHAVVAGALHVRSGDLAAAREILVTAAEATRRLRDAQFSGPIYVGLVELLLAEGRLDEVDATVDEAVERLAATEETGRRYQVELNALAIRGARARLDRRRAERDDAATTEIRRSAQARIASVRADLAAAMPMAKGTLDELVGHALLAEAELASLERREPVAAWGKAVAHWAAVGRPYHIAWARYRQAEAILGARGAARSTAEPALAEAAAIARGLGAAPLVDAVERLARMARIELRAGVVERAADGPTPDFGTAAASAPPAAPERPFGLTARELEVVPLIVDGYSNRKIAERLFISESTAGVHVSNILGKLGVTTRVEAAAIAVRAGLA